MRLSIVSAALFAGLLFAPQLDHVALANSATPAKSATKKNPTPTVEVSVPRQVLAYYYGWWANPTVSRGWGHWQGVNTANHTIASTRWYPADGPYDSHDAVEVEKQSAEAQAAGITGWVYSWWGPSTFTDNTVPLLLQTAARHNLHVAIAVEQLLGSTTDLNQQNALTYVDYILSHYANDPAYLKVNGRPVIFLNTVSMHQISLPAWRAIFAQAAHDTGVTPFIAGDNNLQLAGLTTCDAVYSYDLEHQMTENKTLTQIQNWARPHYVNTVNSMGDRVAIATILPGHDASEMDSRPQASQMITQRYNGATYSALWQGAIAGNPDWILIVSWNEWHEGSQIEPSYQFGTQALDTNAAYATQFLALPPKSHTMN